MNGIKTEKFLRRIFSYKATLGFEFESKGNTLFIILDCEDFSCDEHLNGIIFITVGFWFL